jgi:small subunit ribosomal protein S17
MAEQETKAVARRQIMTGSVASAKGDKTIRVLVNHLVKHQAYGKYVRKATKVAVHDPQNDAKLGDTVEISMCRRISKSKSWRLLRIIRRGDSPMVSGEKEE